MADAPLTAEAYLGRARRGRPAIGYMLVLGAVGLWSLNATMAKVIVDSGGLTPLRLAELRATGAGLILFAAVALVRPQSLRIERRELGFFLLSGVAGLALVLAGVVAYAWLGEEISEVQILGGILVLGGIALAQTARFGAV